MPVLKFKNLNAHFLVVGTLLVLASCAPAEKVPEFDFEALTLAEREVWLQARAEETSKGYLKGLNRNGLSLYSEEPVKANANRREITVTARLDSSLAKVNIKPEQKKQLEKSMCKDYLRTEYYKFKITVVNRILENNKREAFRLTQSPHFCENMAKSAD